MEQERFSLQDAIALLERTPHSLSAMLQDLPENWIRATEGEKTWSAYDVIGHLIHGEHTDWIPRARHIMAGRQEPFEKFDRTAQFRESKGKNLSQLLQTFADLRQKNIATLKSMNLTEADLQRKGMHPELGEVNLAQLIATWVVHDLDHVAQVTRTMAKSYGKATGPWIAYLSILTDKR